jgi:hypothetical protein
MSFSFDISQGSAADLGTPVTIRTLKHPDNTAKSISDWLVDTPHGTLFLELFVISVLNVPPNVARCLANCLLFILP